MKAMKNLLAMRLFVTLLFCYKTIAESSSIEQQHKDIVASSLVECNPVDNSVLQPSEDDERCDEISIMDKCVIVKNNIKQEVKGNTSCNKSRCNFFNYIVKKIKAIKRCLVSFFKRCTSSHINQIDCQHS